MPGRYSHGLVLAQYSSQGIISVPNDDYLGSSAQTRTTSAVAPRQRTTSNATKSSGYQSIPAQSVPSSTSKSQTYNLKPNRSGTTQKRVVIVQSDSEGENDLDESEEERVRPQPVSCQRFTPPAHTRTSSAARKPSPSQPVLRSALRQSTTQSHEKPSQSKASSQRAPIDSKPTKKRSGGVRALIEARNKVEMEKASADGTSDQEQRESSLSLREFLRDPPKPNGPTEKSLTVKEFLQHMPAPDAKPDGEEASAHRADRAVKIDASPKTPLVTRSVPETEPATGDQPSAYRAQKERNLEKPGAARSARSLPHETEPNFSDFKDVEEQSHFPFPVTCTPATIATTSQKATHRILKEKPVNVRTKKTPTSPENPTPVNHGHQAAFTATQRGPLVHGTTRRKSESRHVGSESSLSSLDSQDSSIFGMSSIGGTTQATSGSSPTFRTLDKSTYQRDSNLPRARHGKNDDNFDDILNTMNKMTANFTSDEEADDREHDLPAPRLQNIPEKDLSTGQWGTISARQSTSTRAREADELSEMSAVFPPDIGRYKLEAEVTRPLTMALSGMSEVEAKEPRRSDSVKSKAKKSANETGLLRKLKKKATR